ncbi:MAG: DNA polymerase IV [bacterium]
MPIVLHIDFNSYFASVEQQANPFLRGKPIAVAGKGKRSIDLAAAHKSKARFNLAHIQLERTVVTTASYEAKRMGVKTAMSSTEAKKICPELIIVPGDPRKYSEITKRFLSILRRYADAVEQFSTDEAFADLTSCGDYFGATIIAQMIRADLKRECGASCTASIGIGPNKLIAKLASESVKPNGFTVISPDLVNDFILSRELDDICGIGPRIKSRLHGIGISTMESLRKASLSKLVDEFKPSYGHFLYAAACGLGDDSVVDSDEAPKSIGHSYTYSFDLDRADEIKRNLLVLCDRVAWRMRRDGFIGTHLSVYARYSSSLGAGRTSPTPSDRPWFSGAGRSKRFQEPMHDGLEIYKNAWAILNRIRDPNCGIRLLGVSVSGLILSPMPNSLFPKQQKMRRVLTALDQIQTRYGASTWQRVATLGTELKERTSGWTYDHEI